MDGERMHAALELARQRRIDHPVTFDPALPAEAVRHDIESEVGLSARPMPGMALVKSTIRRIERFMSALLSRQQDTIRFFAKPPAYERKALSYHGSSR